MGSAESEEYDQVLDTVYVGPVPEGRHKFVFQVSSLFGDRQTGPLKVRDQVRGVTDLLILALLCHKDTAL